MIVASLGMLSRSPKDRETDTQQIVVSPDLKALRMTVPEAGQRQPNILVFDRK